MSKSGNGLSTTVQMLIIVRMITGLRYILRWQLDTSKLLGYYFRRTRTSIPATTAATISVGAHFIRHQTHTQTAISWTFASPCVYSWSRAWM